MDNCKNILDENILKDNINFAALFVLNYECLKEYVVNQVRDFYAENISFDDEKVLYEESQSYKESVRKLDKNIENASLKWFIQADAINQHDYDVYQKIRGRRNDIIHQLMKNLNYGFSEEDAHLFTEMLSIYSKIDKWWINEIEIPISGENIPGDYDRNQVMGGQAMILSIINSIIFDGKGNEYKELLNSLCGLS